MLRMFFTLLVASGILGGALSAQSSSFETDARERARLEVRRYAILRAHLDAAALPEAARSEMSALDASLRAIDQRYRNASTTVAGGGLYQLQNRTRELVAGEIAPSWNRIMLERFPLPEQVRRDFNSDVRYAAALTVIGFEFTLGRTIRPPRTPELDARDALYNQASETVIAKYKSNGEQSREWRGFDRDSLALSQSAAFKREVLGRYVPLFAGFVRDDPSRAQGAGGQPPSAAVEWMYVPVWGDEFGGTVIFRGHALMAVVAGLLLAGLLLVPVWLSRRQGLRHNAPRQRQPSVSPLALPPDLQLPALPGGMRPELFVENARVLDLQTWSETSVSWQSSSGNAYVAPQVSVRTTTVQKDRLWVQTPDGIEQAWMITGGVFAANRGHFLTWVQARREQGEPVSFLIFNHNTQKWHDQDWVAAYHDRFWRHWLLLNVLWLVPGCFALNWLMRTMRGPEDLLLPLLGAMVVLSFVWVGLNHGLIMRRRQSAWQTHYRPRVLDWLKSLRSSLPSAPTSSISQAE